MNRNEYKEKLRAFNSTEKYKQELSFLDHMMQPTFKDNILDFGCGTGHAVNYFRDKGVKCYGYDIENYRDEPNNSIFRSNFEGLIFDKVYFMHSFSHLSYPVEVLLNLKRILLPKAKIYIITPNKNWVAWNYNRDYVRDPTVKEYFNIDQLTELLNTCGYEPEIYGQFGQNTFNQNERLFMCAKLL